MAHSTARLATANAAGHPAGFWTGDVNGPVATGSDAHKRLFCRMLLDTHDPYKPAVIERFEVRVKTGSEGERLLRLDPVAGAAGEFEGSLVAEQLGLCEITASVPGGTARDAVALKAVRVTLPRLEFKDTRMNEPLLRQIAVVTGGEFLTLNRIGELPKLLPKREQLLVNEQTQDIWDTPLALCVFCGLLFTEWAIRKWKNLA